MDPYMNFSGQGGFEESIEDPTAQNGPPLQHQYQQNATGYAQEHAKPPYMNPPIPAHISCDIKPRLTKEQHDILEAHYQAHPKPTTNIKKSFAENLGVTLEKVNNWFQNRRAKSKQDAKKQNSAINLFAQQGNSSDAEPSPNYPTTTSDYARASQQWMAEQHHMTNGLGISDGPQFHEQVPVHHMNAPNAFLADDLYQQFDLSAHVHENVFDSPLEQNRRTLTQENFNAMAKDGGMMNGSGDFEDFQTGFSGNQDVINQVFPEFPNDFKTQDVFTFPHPVGAPLSSNDSTIPSNASERSLHVFPSSSAIEPHATVSANSSEWGDSRSSSLHEGAFLQMQRPISTSQWHPGDSVPVDVAALNEEFKGIAQARANNQEHEQPLAWPDDDAFTRRDSQASMLAQCMGSVGLQTPHPQQSATFKSPPPLSNIAARRMRPRPAALGQGALRSNSYNVNQQPASPGQVQQQSAGFNGPLALRRIKSSQGFGSVSQGRVMKSIPGSAQRSPLNLTFNDALNSPHATRHASLQNHSLAPPTPLSPGSFSRNEQARQMASYQVADLSRQSSISENDFENGVAYHPPGSLPAQNFTSPPHTPQYYQQQFVPTRFASNNTMENTPPQSAPAGQTCFPSNVFAVQPIQPQPVPQLQLQQIAMAQPSMPVNNAGSDRQYNMVNVSTSGPHQSLPYHFPNGGVPMVMDNGNLGLAYPPNMQFMQQQQAQSQPQPMPASQQFSYPFITSSSPSDASVSTQASKSTTEMFVHEYTPPDSIKRAATPRKPVDSGPKNYTFSHTSVENFEGKKSKKSDKESSIGSSSPASSVTA